MSDQRDALRSKLLEPKKFKTKKVNIFGQDIEIRQPSVGQIFDASEEDPKKAMVKIMLNYCYVPGSNERIFEPGDAQAILSWPVDDWLTHMNEAVAELTGAEMEQAAKNLESDQADNSSVESPNG